MATRHVVKTPAPARSAPAGSPAPATTLSSLVAQLEESLDSGRLEKARTMLKAERFQLFSDVGETEMVGVVKSQSDDSLFYSCRLTALGEYSCCTQNLNACGGLRGAPCKHLLVMILGLAQSGALDVTKASSWVSATRTRKPALDKDKAGATFLRYKSAQAGELDWRPTETVPEDFYAL